MGHLRLGRLPKTQKWVQVVDLLDHPYLDAKVLAGAILRAADAELQGLSSDSTVGYCFWLLTRVTWAARSPDFANQLNALGIRTESAESALTFISEITDVVRSRLTQSSESTVFGELASLALRRSLIETVGAQTKSLFGSSVNDLQLACRSYSTEKHFGELGQRFFGDFLARSLKYFISKEISNHVGEKHGLGDIQQSSEFERALDVYARQSARIVREFASSWYSLHNWESRGAISTQEAQAFLAVALRKLRMELKRESAHP